jgi:hypothetical protein
VVLVRQIKIQLVVVEGVTYLQKVVPHSRILVAEAAVGVQMEILRLRQLTLVATVVLAQL